MPSPLLIKTPVIGFKAHPKSRVISSQDPQLFTSGLSFQKRSHFEVLCGHKCFEQDTIQPSTVSSGDSGDGVAGAEPGLSECKATHTEDVSLCGAHLLTSPLASWLPTEFPSAFSLSLLLTSIDQASAKLSLARNTESP